MIDFDSFILDNGLQVLVHEDAHCNIAVLNVLYHVGAADESPTTTGLAHLCEHLMFSGSIHIPSYDEALQRVGGDNNAFTTPDITNYYCTLPAKNIETGFWLESDRMLSLKLNNTAFNIQKNVVIEEFKEQHLNQPYGDLWLHLLDIAYIKHPYRWPTIGKKIDHIEKITLDDVHNFFEKFYSPNNATLVVAGCVKLEQIKQLSKKWFEPIPAKKKYQRQYIKEPIQKTARNKIVTANVPLNAVYKAYPIPGRMGQKYQTIYCLAEILGGKKSSKLYSKLVEELQLFNSIHTFVTDNVDNGLFIIGGRLNDDITIDKGEKAIEEIIHSIQTIEVDIKTVESIKNQAEIQIVHAAMDVLYRAQELAIGNFVGDPNLINKEMESMQKITAQNIQYCAQQFLQPRKTSTVKYLKKHKGN